MSDKQSSPVDFEKSLQELETLVTTMEQGDLPLEDALKAFERGVALTRTCQQALSEAEQRVQILLANEENPSDYDTAD